MPYAGSPKLHSSHSTPMRTGSALRESRAPTYTPYLLLTAELGRSKLGKGTMGRSILLFPATSSFAGLSGGLIQGSHMKKEGYHRAPGASAFLRMPLPSFCTQRTFWSKQEVWPVGALHAFASSVSGETR